MDEEVEEEDVAIEVDLMLAIHFRNFLNWSPIMAVYNNNNNYEIATFVEFLFVIKEVQKLMIPKI